MADYGYVFPMGLASMSGVVRGCPPGLTADRNALAKLIGYVAADMVIAAGWRPLAASTNPQPGAPRKPTFDPADPAMVSAVREYFEHGFDDETIMAVSFPGLTPEILAGIRLG